MTSGRASRALVVGIALGGLAACVPILPHTYWRPDAVGAASPQNPCWKTHEEVRFVRGAGTIGVRIVRPDGTRAFVEVALQLPEGHHARVERADVALVDASGARASTLFDGVAPVQKIEGDRLPIASRLEGRTFQTSPVRIDRNYWLYAPIDVASRELFTLSLPPIDVDDAPVSLPDIRFTRTTEVQPLAPLQC